MLAGDVDGALRAYRAPLLVESEVPRLVQAREELEGALRRAALLGGQDTAVELAGDRERARRRRRRCASSCAKRRPTTRAPRSPWRGCAAVERRWAS